MWTRIFLIFLIRNFNISCLVNTEVDLGPPQHLQFFVRLVSGHNERLDVAGVLNTSLQYNCLWVTVHMCFRTRRRLYCLNHVSLPEKIIADHSNYCN